MKASALAGFGVALALCATPPCRAQLLAPDAPVAGLSQAELSARWWQWAVSFPDGANPVQETTGELSFLGADQTPVAHPGVFFLAGAFTTDPVTRSVTIGPNDFLFFPVINLINVRTDPDETEVELRGAIAPVLDAASDLFATLDGTPLASAASLLGFDQTSPPGLFDIQLPENNVFGLAPGTYQAVSDGYWLALEPLAPGNHQLSFGGRNPGFSQNITYNITVVPEPFSGISLATGMVGVCGYLLRRHRKDAGPSNAFG